LDIEEKRQSQSNQKSRGIVPDSKKSNQIMVPSRKSIQRSKIALMDKYVILLPLFSLKKGDSMNGKTIKLQSRDFIGEIDLEVVHAPYGELPKKIFYAALKEVSILIKSGRQSKSGFYWLATSISEFIKKYNFYRRSRVVDYFAKFKEALADLHRASYIPRTDIQFSTKNGETYRIFSMDEKVSLVEKIVIIEGYSPSGKVRKKIIGIKFPDWIVNNLLNGYISVIDFNFWDVLSSPLSKRLYEILLPRFYASYSSRKVKRIVKVEISYSKLCQLMPLKPKNHLSRAKKQLMKAFTELVEKEFLASLPEWTEKAYKTYSLFSFGEEEFYSPSSDWNIVFEAGDEFFRQVRQEEELLKELESKPSLLESVLFREEVPPEIIIEASKEVPPEVIQEIEIAEEERFTKGGNKFSSSEEAWEFLEKNCLWKALENLDLEITRKNIQKICDYLVEKEVPISVVREWCIEAEAQDNPSSVIAALIQKVKDYIKDNDLPPLFKGQEITFTVLRKFLTEIGYNQSFAYSVRPSYLLSHFIEYVFNDFNPKEDVTRKYSQAELKNVEKQIKELVAKAFYDGNMNFAISQEIKRRLDSLDLNSLEKRIVSLVLHAAEMKKRSKKRISATLRMPQGEIVLEGESTTDVVEKMSRFVVKKVDGNDNKPNIWETLKNNTIKKEGEDQ